MTAMYYGTLKMLWEFTVSQAQDIKSCITVVVRRVLLFSVTYIAIVPSSSRPGPGPVVLAAELTQIKMMVPLHSRYC